MTLVIIAAGMGSRFGGLKQMEPVGLSGEVIAEFSIYDALRAGFNKVVFVIKKEMEDAFKEHVLNKVSKAAEVSYVFQDITDMPPGFSVPEGRVKPWGTGHAVLCCKSVVKEPFVVVNADDFYGASGFGDIYNFLRNQEGSDYCMAGYRLKNTVTESGSVSRGVCRLDENGFLNEITEIKEIEKVRDEIRYTLDGKVYYPLNPDTIVSMNMFGFTPDIFGELEEGFLKFLLKQKGDLTAELYLPGVVSEVNARGTRRVKVLPSKDMWYGFTYKEDMAFVREAVKQMILSGKYPDNLWRAGR